MATEPAETDRPDPHDLCNYGSLGVLNTRPDGIQCHICGDWWTSLAAHAQRTHDLSADEYRATFGFMENTKLVAPALRKPQAERTAEHLRQIGRPHREALKDSSSEERRRRALSAERRASRHPGEVRGSSRLGRRTEVGRVQGGGLGKWVESVKNR